MMKRQLLGYFFFLVLWSACATVATHDENSKGEAPYKRVVVYGVFDGDFKVHTETFTKALMQNLQESGARTKLVVKQQRKDGLRRSPPILNQNDDTNERIAMAVNDLRADLMLVTKLSYVSDSRVGLDVVAVDVSSQEEFWKCTAYVSGGIFFRKTHLKAGANEAFLKLQNDGIIQ